MYEVKFVATDDADWAQAVILIDAGTNQPLDTTDMTFRLEVSDCGTTFLSATSADDGIEVLDDGVVQWRFTISELGSLCVGTTYRIGCTAETPDGTTQIFVGSLAFIDGGFA